MGKHLTREDAAYLRKLMHTKIVLQKVLQFIGVLSIMAFFCGFESIINLILA